MCSSRNTHYAIRRFFAPALIVALGFFLRVYRIDAEGLWIDEAFSIWLARQPLGELVRWVAYIDQHPPLYYGLLHVWIRFLGDSEAAARLLSAFLGVATIPVIYLLGRRLAGEGVGLLSALILAISPFHVRFAQEARMYALLTLSVSLALYALLRLVPGVGGGTGSVSSGSKREVPRWAWILYIVAAAATLWTHNTAFLFLVAANVAVLSFLYNDGMGIREWILAQIAVLLLWLPWLPPLVEQAVGVAHRFWLSAPTLETVVGTVGVLLIDFLPLPLVGACCVTAALAGLALLGLTRLRRSVVTLLLVLFATPFAGEILVSLWHPIFYTRTLIWASLPLYVMLASGVCGLCRRRLSIVVLVVLLMLNGLSLHAYYVDFEKEAWDDAATLVAERAMPGDLILFNDTWGQIPFDYYFRELCGEPVAERGVPVDLFDRGVLEPLMTEDDLPRLRRLVRGRERIWLVYSHDWYTDPQGLIPSALEVERDLWMRWELRGLEVRLYGR